MRIQPNRQFALYRMAFYQHFEMSSIVEIEHMSWMHKISNLIHAIMIYAKQNPKPNQTKPKSAQLNNRNIFLIISTFKQTKWTHVPLLSLSHTLTSYASHISFTNSILISFSTIFFKICCYYMESITVCQWGGVQVFGSFFIATILMSVHCTHI